MTDTSKAIDELAPPRSDAGSVIRIAKNALSGVAVRLITMSVGFFLTPLILTKLGIERFGLWAVISSLASYVGLLDLGLGGTFVKFLSEYAEHGDLLAMRRVTTFGLLFFVAIGICLAVPVYEAAPLIVGAFKMSPNEYVSGVWLFRVMYVLVIATMISGLPAMVIIASHRMDIVARNSLYGYVSYAIVTVIVMRQGWGVSGLVLASGMQIGLTTALNSVYAYQLIGTLFISPTNLSRQFVIRLLAFGGWTQITSICTIINLDVGRFVAAGIVSVTGAGFYEVGGKLAFLSRSLPGFFLGALMPAAAAAEARGDQVALKRLYSGGTRYQMLLTLGICGLSAGLADSIVRVWLGKPYHLVSEIVLWLCVGYGINSVTGVSGTILTAGGKPKFEAISAIVGAVTNIGTSILLAPSFGISGVAMATALGFTTSAVYLAVAFTQVKQWNFWKCVGSAGSRLAVAATIASCVVRYLVHWRIIADCFRARLLGLVVLLVLAMGYVVFFLFISWRLGVYAEDQATIAGGFEKFGKMFRRESWIRPK